MHLPLSYATTTLDPSYTTTTLENDTLLLNESPTIFKQNNAKISIGIVKPSFTIAAYGQLKPDNPGPIYNRSFYNFYKPYYDILDEGKSVTTDLDQLTVKISPKASSLKEEDLARYMRDMPDLVREVFPDANVSFINDENVHDGLIFKRDLKEVKNAFDILIIYHEEYVTSQEYSNFKKFVQNGGTLIVMDGNIFYGEVKYDKSNSMITLIEGHGVKFDGKQVIKSMREKWENETREWIGSNFYEFANRKYGPIFVNNPFNYTTVEDQYINNPNASIILDYGSSDPRYNIATYELNYGKGKVITIGLFSASVYNNPLFEQFIKELLISYGVPKPFQNMTSQYGDHYYHIPPLLKFEPSDRESNELSMELVINGSNKSPVYQIQGTSANRSIEFESQDLNYTGKNISLTVGKTFKYGDFLYPPTEPRIFFIYNIKSNSSEYQVAFVHGQPIVEGWLNSTFYKSINSETTENLNIMKILSEINDEFVAITKVHVLVEQNLILNPIEFRFNF